MKMRSGILARARRLLGRIHRDTRAAAATEYILILTLVVLPIAALTPVFIRMIRIYGDRSTSLSGLPFP